MNNTFVHVQIHTYSCITFIYMRTQIQVCTCINTSMLHVLQQPSLGDMAESVYTTLAAALESSRAEIAGRQAVSISARLDSRAAASVV